MSTHSLTPRIAVDVMGGDRGVTELVTGALRAQTQLGIRVLLVGDRPQIQAALQQQANGQPVEIVPADGAVTMAAAPLAELRRKPNASINVAMELVKQGRADAVVSAGHSGAAMAAALLKLGRLPGVERPAIAALLPTLIPHRSALVLDVGANVDCRPSFLDQFAVLGSVYSHSVLGITNPKVGLLNIGEEACKGNQLAIQTHQLLQANPAIRFGGNAEGRDVLSGQFDVIVCDGFTGNTLLKFAESMGSALLQILRDELLYGLHGKIGTHFLKPNLGRVRQRLDHSHQSGGLLLGVNGICLITHGNATANTLFHTIRLAQTAVQTQTLTKLTNLPHVA